MFEKETLDRFVGAMVGTTCGDALGAPYEWKSDAYIAADIARGGLVFHDYKPFDPPGKLGQTLMEAGQPTDDSELAAYLASALLAADDFSASLVYDHLRAFIHGRRPILGKVAYGSGSTLRAALRPATHAESIAEFAAGNIPTPASNGSLMRCIAAPLAARGDARQAAVLGAEQSWVTHRNGLAIASCAIYSIMANLLLYGIEPRNAWEDACRLARKFSDVPHLEADAVKYVTSLPLTSPNYNLNIQGHEGDVVLSLRVAVWATVTATSFANGIIKAISVGGDVDTYGAIAGGLLGLRYGIGGIPEQWLKVLHGREKMTELGVALFNKAQLFRPDNQQFA